MVCIAELRRLSHVVTLRFAEPGEKQLDIWGRSVGPQAPEFGAPTVIGQPIMVEAGAA